MIESRGNGHRISKTIDEATRAAMDFEQWVNDE
jgi:hypothetical protein